MSMYYDKEGKPLNLFQWGRLMENLEYKRVALDVLADGTRISTVWLGLDHSFSMPSEHHQPLIFETMVFSKDSGDELDMERYTTLDQAIAGHKLMLRKYLFIDVSATPETKELKE